jgi:DNA-binding NarL/FixJ family response regulator
MSHAPEYSAVPQSTIWLDCAPPSVVIVGLKRTLEQRARVRVGQGDPGNGPSSIIVCAKDAKYATERVRHLKARDPEASVLIFAPQVDLPLARAALRAGANGYIHAGMRPEHISRAVEVAARGELVVPRKLLEFMLTSEEPADLQMLSARQREVLGLVVEGLSNAEIGKRLYLSESTIKQHLRAAYKLLGVKNRNEAAKLIRDSS